MRATADGRGAKHPVTQGRRRRSRLSGAFVEVAAVTLAEHASEKSGSGSRGLAGVNSMLESWWIHRVLVTTSRLQKLTRGIFPPVGQRRLRVGGT